MKDETAAATDAATLKATDLDLLSRTDLRTRGVVEIKSWVEVAASTWGATWTATNIAAGDAVVGK